MQSISFTGRGHTINSPIVTLRFCPPEIPRIIASPTQVSLQPFRPSIAVTFCTIAYTASSFLSISAAASSRATP
eukprot:scaffold10155_cov196-Ochromonas_danica.AAC.1